MRMKGVFKTHIKKYLFCLFFIIAGSIIAVKFGLWGIDAIRSGKIAAAIFSFAFTVIGLIFGMFSILLFNHNKGAYLTIDNNKIDAYFGYGSELHESISSIKKVEPMRGGTGISLYFPDRICYIINLENAKEICNFITSLNDGSQSYMTVDEATSNLSKHKNRFVRLLILTFVFVILLFVHIAWCVLLTEGKDLGDFSQRENIVFVGFAVSELITVGVTFFLADRCGKQNKICELSKLTLLSAAATEHKNESLEKYPSVIGKKYFDDNTYRIVIFAPESDVFAYMLERFDLPSKSWISCYNTAKVFNYLSELYEDIDESFEDVILKD